MDFLKSKKQKSTLNDEGVEWEVRIRGFRYFDLKESREKNVSRFFVISLVLKWLDKREVMLSLKKKPQQGR